MVLCERPYRRSFLVARGITYQVDILSLSQHGLADQPSIDFQAVTEGLVICLGGDGSLLKLVDHLTEYDLPVLGINLGNIGFLTDLAIEKPNQLQSILSGEFVEESRSLLAAYWNENGEQTSCGPALNEIVINRANFNKTLAYSIAVDGLVVADHNADGLIIATPTGSSAYALSAGGPIISPTLPATLILPVCPHKLTSRPICLPSDQHLEVILQTSETRPAAICADGHVTQLLPQDARITIQTHPKSLRLIHPSDYNFYSTLKNKLHWELTPHAQDTNFV